MNPQLFLKIIYYHIIHIYIQCIDKNLCTQTLNVALHLQHLQVRVSLLHLW